MNSYVLTRAFELATKAHIKQTRKPLFDGTGVERAYISHPLEVSVILYNFGFTDPILHAAALLHDCIEDCGYTEEYLLRATSSPEVVSIVVELTDPPGEKGNAGRRAKIARSKTLSLAAKIVLGADMLANLRDVLLYPPWEGTVIRAYCKSNITLANEILSVQMSVDDKKQIAPLLNTVIKTANEALALW